jgi:hypothetical protein
MYEFIFFSPTKSKINIKVKICSLTFPTFVKFSGIFSVLYLFFIIIYFLRPLTPKYRYLFRHLFFPATRERLRMAAAQVGAGVGAAPLPLGLLVVVVLVGLAALVYTKRRTRHKIRRIQEDL